LHGRAEVLDSENGLLGTVDAKPKHGVFDRHAIPGDGLLLPQGGW